MTTKRWMIPVGMLGAAALTLLPLPAAAAPASGTATPLQAVVTLLRPFYSGMAGNALACNALSGRVLACPITPRLLYRLEHPMRFKENGNLVCRCQNPPLHVSWVQTDNNGFVAHVKTGWVYAAGARPMYTITFVVARQDDGWRVDDAYCLARPQTSIYNPPTGPCA
jgi:hypothetical protein